MFFKKQNNSKDSENEIRQKIKNIKIFTRRLMNSSLVGDYLSAFKGTGLEFHQIREYQMGDDIRFIDWNSSAKMNKMMVKQLIEERDRSIILAIDVSASSSFSSKRDLKKNLISQVAAALTFIASENKDRVAALFFSDRVEKWIAPSRGNLHVNEILKNIFCFNATSKRTCLKNALDFLVQLKKRNTVVFMLSDWIDSFDDYHKILKVASCEYDFVGIRVLDDCEKAFPNVGFINVQDSESGELFTIKTRSKIGDKKNNINALLKERLIEQDKLFQKYKLDLLNLNVGMPFLNPMINFFRQRTKRQI